MSILTQILPRVSDELCTRTPLVLTLDGVLTAAECAEQVERIDAAGPTVAPISTGRGFELRPELRNNTRVIFDDAPLAKRLFERVRAQVPPVLEERWHLVGANERLRCYRYQPGQFFGPHFDGAFIRDREERSLLTFIVYLNVCEGGGHTRLLDLGIDVAPKPGTALIFNHLLLHEGAEVTAGIKYALRSDLMYRRGPRS